MAVDGRLLCLPEPSLLQRVFHFFGIACRCRPPGLRGRIVYAVKRTKRRKLKIYRHITHLAYCLLFAVLMSQGLKTLSQEMDEKISVAMNALGQYQEDAGEYPETLGELIPAYRKVPNQPAAAC